MGIFSNFKKKVIEKTDDLLIKTFDKEFLEEPIFTDPNYFENIAKEIIPEESIPQFKKEYDGDEQMYQDLIEYKYKDNFDCTSEEFFKLYYSDRKIRNDYQKSIFIVYTGGILNPNERVIIPRARANEYPNCKKYTLYTKVSNNLYAAKDPVLAPYAQYDIGQELLTGNALDAMGKPWFGDALENF